MLQQLQAGRVSSPKGFESMTSTGNPPPRSLYFVQRRDLRVNVIVVRIHRDRVTNRGTARREDRGTPQLFARFAPTERSAPACARRRATARRDFVGVPLDLRHGRSSPTPPGAAVLASATGTRIDGIPPRHDDEDPRDRTGSRRAHRLRGSRSSTGDACWVMDARENETGERGSRRRRHRPCRVSQLARDPLGRCHDERQRLCRRARRRRTI